MSDKLTEALNAIERAYMDQKVPPAVLVIPAVDAARRWASFPTDNDVRIVQESIGRIDREGVRLALEAVKREDRSKTNPATEKAVEVMRTNLDAVKREDR